MSKSRKEKKAAAIQRTSLGNSKQVAHMPTNSSHTARLGSSSEGPPRLPVAQTPARNPRLMSR